MTIHASRNILVVITFFRVSLAGVQPETVVSELPNVTLIHENYPYRSFLVQVYLGLLIATYVSMRRSQCMAAD